MSYKVRSIQQTELTAKDIFSECYAKQIIQDYYDGKVTLDDIEKKYLPKKATSDT